MLGEHALELVELVRVAGVDLQRCGDLKDPGRGEEHRGGGYPHPEIAERRTQQTFDLRYLGNRVGWRGDQTSLPFRRRL